MPGPCREECTAIDFARLAAREPGRLVAPPAYKR